MADAIRETVIARAVRERGTAREKTDERLRMTFWIFVFLMLTDGIFRRWILPGSVGQIFLVIRDPFVLYAVVIGWNAGYIRNGHAVMMMVLGVVSFLSALVFGHGNLFVALYGMRIIFLYFPFMYVMARVLRRDDVLMLGKVMLLILIPNVLLTIVQFFSPQSAFVNLGVGQDEAGAGFSGGAMGYYRPPGMFNMGTILGYYGITYGFLLYFLISPEDSRRMGLSKRFLIACMIAYLVSIPVSISRTHFAQTFIITCFFFVVLVRQGRAMKKIVPIIILMLIVFPLLMLIPDMQLFVEVFTARFEGANETEGGLANSAVNRSFGYMFRSLADVPVMGFGTGQFSNVGMMYTYGVTNNIDIPKFKYIADSTEMELGRIIGEDGLIVGMLIILTRWHMMFRLGVRALRKLWSAGDCLPWMLLPFSCLELFWGQLKASYNLAWMSMIVISCLTALKYTRRKRSPAGGTTSGKNDWDGK